MLLPPPPQRFRRPLLLQPGWLALGCLLLLGTLLLQKHWQQLRLVNALQITMPPLKANASLIAFYRERNRGRNTADYNPYTDVGDKNALAKIDRMRPWHTIDFGGQPLADFFNAQAIESIVRLIIADSGHASGVRIRFRANTTYANLVRVLDIINYTGQKKYWLDNRLRPATLYAITDKVMPKDSSQLPDFICGFRYQAQILPSPLFGQRFLAEYWLPGWRLPWLLLLALGVLSVRKLGGAARRRGPAT